MIILPVNLALALLRDILISLVYLISRGRLVLSGIISLLIQKCLELLVHFVELHLYSLKNYYVIKRYLYFSHIKIKLRLIEESEIPIIHQLFVFLFLKLLFLIWFFFLLIFLFEVTF